MAWDDPAGCRDVLGACRDPATPRGDSQPLLSLFPAPSCFPRLPSPDPPRIWAGLEVSCWLLLLRSDLIWLQMFVPAGEIPGKHKLRLVLGKKTPPRAPEAPRDFSRGWFQRSQRIWRAGSQGLDSEMPKDWRIRIPGDLFEFQRSQGIYLGFKDPQGLDSEIPKGWRIRIPRDLGSEIPRLLWLSCCHPTVPTPFPHPIPSSHSLSHSPSPFPALGICRGSSGIAGSSLALRISRRAPGSRLVPRSWALGLGLGSIPGSGREPRGARDGPRGPGCRLSHSSGPRRQLPSSFHAGIPCGNPTSHS